MSDVPSDHMNSGTVQAKDMSDVPSFCFYFGGIAVQFYEFLSTDMNRCLFFMIVFPRTTIVLSRYLSIFL